MAGELTPRKNNGLAAANDKPDSMKIIAWARMTDSINTHDPEQLQRRTDEYFSFCAENNIIPIVETYCNALHISKQSFENYLRRRVKSMPTECIEILMEARQQILSSMAMAAIDGRVNPVWSMFYLKVHGRYDDQPSKDVPQTDIVDEENRQTAQDIMMKYQDIPDDE